MLFKKLLLNYTTAIEFCTLLPLPLVNFALSKIKFKTRQEFDKNFTFCPKQRHMQQLNESAWSISVCEDSWSQLTHFGVHFQLLTGQNFNRKKDEGTTPSFNIFLYTADVLCIRSGRRYVDVRSVGRRVASGTCGRSVVVNAGLRRHCR